MILVVEDDPGLRELILDDMKEERYEVIGAESAEEASRLLLEHSPDLIISDLRLPGADGLELLAQSRKAPASPAFIIITAFGTVEQAVAALQRGADNFLTKPLNLDHLRLCVRRALKQRELQQEISRYREVLDAGDFHGIIGRSDIMRRLFEQIRLIAGANGPVLLLGESGSGKELVARAIHAESDRGNGPFVAVNCAGIPEELLESELFGHSAGAFTGAQRARKGLFVEASGGTILLDEIGEMSLAMQAKLLRILQDGAIRPVGEDQEQNVDTRVIAATNRNLENDIGNDIFRSDLFYRLETFTLQIQPLRDREDDIDLLAAHFVARFSTAADKRVRELSSSALECLRDYPFPGNVRELSNAIERAVAFAQGDRIEVHDLPERIRRHDRGIEYTGHHNDAGGLLVGRKLPTLRELEERYVRYVLEQMDGNKSRTASHLGIGRRTLYRYLNSDRS